MSANQTQQILRQEFHLPNQSILTTELLTYEHTIPSSEMGSITVKHLF